jgi:hypothetical protein
MISFNNRVFGIGAHVAAMAVWERFNGEHRRRRYAEKDRSMAGSRDDVRQPWQFVGLAGVYDIVEHLEHEKKRGVAPLSCMAPANGSLPHLLEAMSPVRLFRQVVVQEEKGKSTSSSSASLHEILPKKFTLICSKADVVVPPTTSLAFHKMLLLLFPGGDCSILSLDNLQHRDFLRLDAALPESDLLRNHLLHRLRQ